VGPNPLFTNKSPEFWAAVKLVGQLIGYSDKNTNSVKIPDIDSISKKFTDKNLDPTYLIGTALGDQVIQYLKYRADILNTTVKQSLMNKVEAEQEFNNLLALNPKCKLPQNKQKGDKRKPAFLTCIVNILLEHSLSGKECCYDPRMLTHFIKNSKPVSVMSRRVDGAYPSVTNPKAIWEIKEYYHTTTFGSRVADGIYETILDGTELNAVRNHGFDITHILIIDDYNTWWVKGKSYLCRLIDALHEGHLSELIVGRQVLIRVPELAKTW